MTIQHACKFCHAETSLVPARKDGYRCANLTQCAERMAKARATAAYSRDKKRAKA